MSSQAASTPQYTRHDVYHVAFLLQQKLPPELIPQIMDYAEYWLKSTVGRDGFVEIADIRIMSPMSKYECPGIAYVSTLPIGECPNEEVNGIELVGLHPVRKVVFTVDSQDQGWSSYPDDHGTERGCWTWFEAAVRNANQPAYQDIVREHFEGGSRAPAPPAAEGRELLRNLHALKEWRVYSRTWTISDEDEETRNWVKGLERGQIIDLTAWARFVGWRNRINSARIDVYLAAIR